MNKETLTTILFFIVALAICAALHWLIGIAQQRVRRRLTLSAQSSEAAGGVDDAPQSVKRLIVDWGANGLRTLIWPLYFVFLVNVLPQTRDEFGHLSGRLFRVRDYLLRWLIERGIKLVIIIVATIFLTRFVAALIKTGFQVFERRAVEQDQLATRRRLRTLSAIFSRSAQVITVFVGSMIFLQQLQVDITPILASAGVVGIAVGFGAQSLIKDLFGGFLILLEDQFNVGETVKIGDVSGTVEHLTLRSTRIRSLDGSLTTIPNGNINAVSNLSKGWARAVLDIEVDYAEDVDRAMQVALEVAQGVFKERPQDIIEEPAMWGIDRVSNSIATIRLVVKTKPSKQPEIGRELRRRVKQAFEREKIKTPSAQPQIVVLDQGRTENAAPKA